MKGLYFDIHSILGQDQPRTTMFSLDHEVLALFEWTDTKEPSKIMRLCNTIYMNILVSQLVGTL